jgi:hypothetical protein
MDAPAAGVTSDPNVARFAWWKLRFGHLALSALTEETLDRAFADLASEDATYYAGKAKDGQAIFRSRGKRSWRRVIETRTSPSFDGMPNAYRVCCAHACHYDNGMVA